MSQNLIQNVCCTCLSTDRKVRQLCKILDGINFLYMLLSLDAEAYKRGFYREPSSLLVCWECAANINKIKRFRKQVCAAQKLLASIDEERNVKLRSLSHLTIEHNTPQYEFNCTYLANEENFIDCGSIIKEIKSESDDDIPLSIYCKNTNINDEIINSAVDNDDDWNENAIEQEDLTLFDDKCNLLSNDLVLQSQCNTKINNAVFSRKDNTEFDKSDRNVTDEQGCKKNKICSNNISILSNKSDVLSKETTSMKSGKIQPGRMQPEKSLIELDKINISKNQNSHNKLKTSKKKTKYSKYFSIHTMTEEEMLKSVKKIKRDIEKDAFKCDKCFISLNNEEEVLKHNKQLHQNNLSECHICHLYIEDLGTHIQSHHSVYECVLCTHTTHTRTDIVRHLKGEHYEICCKRKKDSSERKSCILERTYPCSECDSIFRNKDLRWKHVQKTHREGFQCTICSKKFAFKSNLERHQRSHGPLRRRECPVCHKAIRVDLWSTHAHTHTHRQTYTCVECDKVFASQATYHSHLKYARAHATQDVRSHACTLCSKRYRSRGELLDHVTYAHEGRAKHRCPVCDKGLATKRCVRRHVRRAHEGIKESAKDKVCQVCGRAFRDKKTLLEHELVHSGARPLNCNVCGRAFRQRAALHKHTQRLHLNKLV